MNDWCDTNAFPVAANEELPCHIVECFVLEPLAKVSPSKFRADRWAKTKKKLQNNCKKCNFILMPFTLETLK